MLERGDELRCLRALVQRTREGRGGIVVVEGPAGIGKTRLLDATAELAEAESLLVLRASAGELEGSLGFGVVRQLFEPLLRHAVDDDRENILAGAAGLAAPVFGGATPAGREPSPEATPSAVLHGLFWLCANLAERRPLLLVIDDLHWSDERSLLFLAYLARRLADVAVSIVAATRPRAAGTQPGLLGALPQGALVDVIRLAPLSIAATSALVERRLCESPAPEFAEACHEATGGNPFLLGELLAQMAAEGVRPTAEAAGSVVDYTPEAVALATVLRLSRLPPSATEVARAVAILHGVAQVRHVAALTGLDVARAAEMVDALVAEDLLREGRPLQFRHPLVRTAVLNDTPPAMRAAGHARAAQVLTEDQAPIELVASHLLRTEPDRDPATVATLREAAARAATAGSPETSIEYLRRALDEPPPAVERAELLAALGALELRLGLTEGVEHLLAALGASSDPRLRGEIAGHLAAPLMYAGQADQAADLLESVIPDARRIDPELALRLELELLTSTRVGAGPRIDPARMAELAALPGFTTAERGVLSMFSYIATAGRHVTAGEGAALAERALADGRIFAEATADWHAAYWALNALIVCDELERAERIVERALEDAAARGSTIGFVLATGTRGAICFHRGALTEAQADARTALELAVDSGYHALISYAVAYLGSALAELGQLDGADELLDRYGFSGEIADEGVNNLVLQVRCLLRLAQGRTSEALADGVQMDERARRWDGEGDMPWRSAYALALAGNGQLERARRVAHDHHELERRFGAPRGLGAALRAAGLLEQGPRRLGLLAEAVQTLERSPSRLEHAKALVEYGAALRRANQRAAARDPLREGLEIAARCGARTLVERAETELRATGARPRRTPVSGLDALTASERRVASLAAEGVTNPDIAQRLFVTLRTVESHLTSAYRKLGITSRRELPAALERSS